MSLFYAYRVVDWKDLPSVSPEADFAPEIAEVFGELANYSDMADKTLTNSWEFTDQIEHFYGLVNAFQESGAKGNAGGKEK